jgi:hypothetical protein
VLYKNCLCDLVVAIQLLAAPIFVTGALDLVEGAVGEIDDVGSALLFQPAQIAQQDIAEVLLPHALRLPAGLAADPAAGEDERGCRYSAAQFASAPSRPRAC